MHRTDLRPLNWIQWSTLALLLLVPVLSVIILIHVQDVQRHQNDALHSIICRVEAAELRSPVLSTQEKHHDIRFWSAALNSAHLKPCE